MLTSFWDCLKYSRLHCYLYLFLKFPCILFLFQAESVKAVRRDGKWRDLSGVVKKPERSGLESEKTSGVWVRLFTLPFCRSAATILPFVYFPPFYWLNIWNRGKGNLCIPSEAFLWKLDRQLMHDETGGIYLLFLWKLDRQLMHDETGGIYLHHYIPKSWREHNVPNKLLSLLQIFPIRYFAKWKSIMPTSHLF